MTVHELGTRRVTTADGAPYELVSFDLTRDADRAGVHRVSTSAFDREYQFLFEVVAPPCLEHAVGASRARTERHVADRLRRRRWTSGTYRRSGPSAS